MPNTYHPMKLSLEEEAFLRRWMYDELHYQEGVGPAKRLQVQHGAIPADLASLIAAAIPASADQEAAAQGACADTPPTWPWTNEAFLSRLRQARAYLADRQRLSRTIGMEV